MSDPRYAPPAEAPDELVPELDQKIAKWAQIHALTGIPVQTSPITLPVVIGFYLLGSPTTRLSAQIAIGIGVLLSCAWIFATFRLDKLKGSKFKKEAVGKAHNRNSG